MSLITPVSLLNTENNRTVPVFLETDGSSTKVNDFFTFPNYSQIVVGDFNLVNSSTRQNIVHLDRFGGIESIRSVPDFATKPLDEITCIEEYVKSYGSGTTDDYLIGGTFLTTNGTSTKYLARLNKNFNLHANQFPQTFNGSVNTIDIFNKSSSSDTQFCISGGFTAPRSKVAVFSIDSGNNIVLNAMSIAPTGTVYQAKFSYSNDGIFLVGDCAYSSRHGLIGVTTGGALFAGFNANISAVSRDVRVMEYVNRNVLNSDILIGGTFTIGATQYSIARLDYLTGAVTGSWATDLNNAITTTAIYYENNVDSPNYNKILCASGSQMFLLDGTTGIVDTTFNNNLGYVLVSNVRKITTVENGNIVICGSFTSVNGDSSKKHYCVLSPDGSTFI